MQKLQSNIEKHFNQTYEKSIKFENDYATLNDIGEEVDFILVLDEIKRTEKVLLGICYGIPLVKADIGDS